MRTFGVLDPPCITNIVRLHRESVGFGCFRLAPGKKLSHETTDAASAPSSAFGISPAAAAASDLRLEAVEDQFGGFLALHELCTLHVDGREVLSGETGSCLIDNRPYVGVDVRGASFALLCVDIYVIMPFQHALLFRAAHSIVPQEVSHGCVVLVK